MTSATPLVSSAACATDSSTPTAWPAARNVPVEAVQASALKASAATSVPRPAGDGQPLAQPARELEERAAGER